MFLPSLPPLEMQEGIVGLPPCHFTPCVICQVMDNLTIQCYPKIHKEFSKLSNKRTYSPVKRWRKDFKHLMKDIEVQINI